MEIRTISLFSSNRLEFEGYIQLCWTEKISVTKLQEERTVRKCMHLMIMSVWLLQVLFLVLLLHSSYHCIYGVCKSPLKTEFMKNIVKVDMVVWEIGIRI